MGIAKQSAEVEQCSDPCPRQRNVKGAFVASLITQDHAF